jgi:hypothetical protein
VAARGGSALLAQAVLPAPRLAGPIARMVGALLCVVLLASIGFGTLAGGWTLHGDAVGLLAGLLLSWGLSPVLVSLARARRHHAVEWPPGLYLFEHGLVDGSMTSLPRCSLARLTHVGVLRRDPSAGRGFGGLELHFGSGERVLLPVRGGDAAVRLGEEVRRLAPGAPLWDREPGKVAPADPLWPMLIALLLGLVLGLGIWGQRDRLSDDLAFESAWPSSGSGGLRLYLRHVDGRHAGVIRGDLLPRAALAEAVERNTIRALLQWRREFPGPGATTLFEEAQAELYARARANLALRSGQGGAAESSRRTSMAALIDYQEGAGSPPLAVRFDPVATRWLDEIDTALAGSHDGRSVARAGPHVEGIPLVRRRRHLADSVEQGVQLLLGVGLFSLASGEGPVAAGQPGLWVRSTVRPGTSVFEAEGREELLVELEITLQLELGVPGQEPILLDLSLQTPDVFVAPDRPLGTEPPVTLIYEAMLRRVMDGISVAFAEAFG